MNLELFIPFLSAALGGAIVASVNHFLTSRREQKRKLADLRVQTLIDAWKKIEAASNIEDWKNRDKNLIYAGLEEAIASVMLLGDPEEIETARTFCRNIASGNGASTLELLQGLKSSLRRELGLRNSPDDYIFLRMHRDEIK